MKYDHGIASSPTRRMLRRRICAGLVAVLAGCQGPGSIYWPEPIDPPRRPPSPPQPPPSPPQPPPPLPTPPPAPQIFPATLSAEFAATVIRRGQAVSYSAGMQLYVGDRIEINPNNVAVISNRYGDEVFLRGGAQVQIGSIFVFFGEIFARIVTTQGRDLFRVESNLVSAGPEGTEFLVRIDRSSATQVIVRKGTVRCSSRRGDWAFMRVNVGQQFTVDARAKPIITPLSAKDFERQFDWVRNATSRLKRKSIDSVILR